MERRIGVKGGRGRGRIQPLDNRTETRGYWKLKDEVLYRTVRELARMTNYKVNE